MFDNFCKNMWLEDCIERDAKGEPLLRKAEYISLNKEYLQDEFSQHSKWGAVK